MRFLKKKIALVLLFLLALATLTGCTNLTEKANTQDTWKTIKKRGTVVVGLDDSFVPMGFRQKNGQLVGYDIDLAKAVFKQYGLKVDFQTIDWSMKETELKNGTIDLIWNGYSITSARKKKVAFSRPYLKNEQVLVTKKQYGIKSFAGIKGKTLGVQTGSTAETFLDEYPKLLKDKIKGKQAVLYDTFPNAFIDLNAGRIQGIFMDEVYARYYINHEKNKSDYQVYFDKNLPSDLFAVGLRKGDKTLRRKINQALGRMQQDGQLAKLNKKWFGTASNYLGKD